MSLKKLGQAGNHNSYMSDDVDVILADVPSSSPMVQPTCGNTSADGQSLNVHIVLVYTCTISIMQMYIRIHVYFHVCLNVQYIQMYYVYIYVYTYVCTYVYMCVHTVQLT